VPENTTLSLPDLPENKIEEKPRPGTTVVSFGSAFGLHQSYFQGYVSHPHREGLELEKPDLSYVQVQGITYSGMSGAPVFTLDGKWIGLNRAAYGYSTTTGSGLVIPAHTILEWLSANP